MVIFVFGRGVGEDISDHGGVLAVELAHHVIVFCLVVNNVGCGKLCLDLREPDRGGVGSKRRLFCCDAVNAGLLGLGG